MVKIVCKRAHILLITLFCLLMPMTSHAAFQASVDRNPVTEGESLILTLKSDESTSDEPDLRELQQDFDILGKSSGSSTKFINGHITHSTQWQITLMPKHSGPLVIPAIKLGNQSTQAIVVGVNKGNHSKGAQLSGELFVDVSAKPRTAYVQEQIIFTVKLYRKIRIGNESTLSDPTFPDMDAVVEKLGDDHSYQTTHKGQAYAVIERRYAVYPQKSGEFKSSPVQFDGVIIEGNRSRGLFTFDPFSQTTRHKRINSPSLSFKIKPAPSSMSSVPWLPARTLKLSERWSSDPGKFMAGEPITRTLTVRADGLAASLLPSLEGEAMNGFKFYPDKPVLNNDKGDNGIMGVRTQKIAILPTRSGSYIFPSIEVKWWNTTTNKMEVARLPAKNITVLPGDVDADNADQPPMSADENQLSEAADAEVGSLDIADMSESLIGVKHTNGWWPWVSLFFAMAWLATFILWLNASKRKFSASIATDNSTTLRKLENQLKKHCMANDAAHAKSDLLTWAKMRWPQHPPTSLTAMAGLCHAELAEALSTLDRSLYSLEKDTWQGDRLWQSFNSHKSDITVVQGNKGDALSSLYLA